MGPSSPSGYSERKWRIMFINETPYAGPNHEPADFVSVETAGGKRVFATAHHLLLTCSGDLQVNGAAGDVNARAGGF